MGILIKDFFRSKLMNYFEKKVYGRNSILKGSIIEFRLPLILGGVNTLKRIVSQKTFYSEYLLYRNCVLYRVWNQMEKYSSHSMFVLTGMGVSSVLQMLFQSQDTVIKITATYVVKYLLVIYASLFNFSLEW